MKRRSMTRRQSKRDFRRGASRSHVLNDMNNYRMNHNVMRGGIRL